MIIDVCETQSGYSFFLTDALNLSRQLSNSLTIRNPPWNVARNTLFISIYVCVEITIYHYWHRNKTNNFTLHIYLQKQKCQHIIYYLNFWNVATQKIMKEKAWLFRDRRSHRLIKLSHHLVYHQPVIIGLVCSNLPASFGLHEAKHSKFVPRRLLTRPTLCGITKFRTKPLSSKPKISQFGVVSFSLGISSGLLSWKWKLFHNAWRLQPDAIYICGFFDQVPSFILFCRRRVSALLGKAEEWKCVWERFTWGY